MTSKRPLTCIVPPGKFVFAIHKPEYNVQNQRLSNEKSYLGSLNGEPHYNIVNLPEDDIEIKAADWVYEVANPFPFKGVTYINKKWADESASDSSRFCLQPPEYISIHDSYGSDEVAVNIITKMPKALCLALATTTTDPRDLIILARLSCDFSLNNMREVIGLQYRTINNRSKAIIHDYLLFEAVANNINTPDNYKIAMVIRPGAQGESEISGEWLADKSHAYEYLRTNSYIPGGHYAANMAEDEIRYKISDLKENDIEGLRHLYYQRSYIRIAGELGIKTKSRQLLSLEDLGNLRQTIIKYLQNSSEDAPCQIDSQATLWGWNFGFDYAPSGYRLHASHQQVHQQYAMVPNKLPAQLSHNEQCDLTIKPYCCGDLLRPIIDEYKAHYGRNYFNDYFKAIKDNKRFDDRDDLESSLIIHEDENVLLFVPKAQTSQWEVQIMTKPSENGGFVGNIVEANLQTRNSLDKAILLAQQVLAKMGAKMITSIEYSKRFSEVKTDQPLIYALLPRLPESPGAFSEAQMRFINGHYPEDFAAACRKALASI